MSIKFSTELSLATKAGASDSSFESCDREATSWSCSTESAIATCWLGNKQKVAIGATNINAKAAQPTRYREKADPLPSKKDSNQ